MLKIILKNKKCLQESIDGLEESRKDDATNFVKKISPEDTAKKEKYEAALTAMLANPIADNKYILWMLKHLEEAPDVDNIMSAVSRYNMIQKNIEDGSPLKDINNIKSLEDLTHVLDDYNKSIKELEQEGQKVILSKEETDGQFEIIRPLNVYASCQLGRNSRWCIAATKSKNYYRQYSRGGVFFYVIMDYSKPVKDANSMFAYAIHKENIDKTEIYNANDDLVKREQVQNSIGKDNEELFYQKMKEEAGVGVQSTTLEKYNTFFSRLMKIIKELPVYNKTNIDLPYDEDSKFTDVEGEVDSYFEELEEIYLDNSQPRGARKNALRHMILFAKKASTINNTLAKYRIGQLIKYEYVDSVPQLRDAMLDLLRNPDWISTSEKNLKNILRDSKEKERFDLAEENFFSKLFEFSEQAIYNDRPEFLNELFDDFQSQRNNLDLDNSEEVIYNSEEVIYKINAAQESVTKAAVFNDHPSALKFLCNIIANNSYSLGTVHQVMNTTYGITKEPTRTKKYADDIFQFVIDKYKSSERYGAKLEDLYSMILKVKDLPPSRYEEALKQSRSNDDGVSFAYNNDINLLDLKYQEKVADMVEKVFERSATGMSTNSLSNAMYGVCLSNTLSKEKISSMLEGLFNPAYRLYRNVPGRFQDVLIQKFENDKKIDSPNFKKFIEVRKNMSESKMFRYDNERKIYRIIK